MIRQWWKANGGVAQQVVGDTLSFALALDVVLPTARSQGEAIYSIGPHTS